MSKEPPMSANTRESLSKNKPHENISVHSRPFAVMKIRVKTEDGFELSIICRRLREQQ